MRSLGHRIVIATVVLTAISVGTAAGGVWCLARWNLVSALDTSLRSHYARSRHLLNLPKHMANPPLADNRAGMQNPPGNEDAPPPDQPPDHGPGNQDDHGPPPLPPEDAPAPGSTAPGHMDDMPLLMRILDLDLGVERFRISDASLTATTTATLLARMETTTSTEPAWERLADGRLLRVLSGVVTLNRNSPPPRFQHQPEPDLPGHRYRVNIVVDGTAYEHELNRLAVLLGILWAVTCLLAVLASAWLRRAVLQPVHHLAGAIRAVDPDHLPARIDVDVPSEMAVIRERLDDLLIRLAKAMEREKGTIADIAHELRTPVAGLRSTLEFATFGADASGRKLAERCLPTVVTMQAMITNLLTLARLESGQEQVACQATDLGEVVADCWRSLEPVAQKRHTVMHITLPDELPEADTCPTKARMVMSNLLDNAIAHAPEGSTTITVELMADDTWVRMVIANPCTGPLPDGDTLFRPFWRGDAARTGGGLHCGLGLALCRRLMTLLRGDITADTTTTGVFRIQLAFPRLTAT